MSASSKPFRIEMTAPPGPESVSARPLAGAGEFDRILQELQTIRALLARQDGPQGDRVTADFEPWAGVDAIQAAIAQTREEIAALRAKGITDPRKNRAADELDAVVGDTESATETILSAAEEIDRAAAQLMRDLKGPKRELASEIQAQVVRMFEACNFQDICGQRISKVVTLLKFIEQRLVAMESAWASVVPFTDPETAEVPAGEAALLNGPGLAGEDRVSQDDIDSLFN